ncbi:MAG: DUF4835 family protein [Bacteroidetes bacterium]|nr:DUF4835 family protein [Bacteroidota bacterium]
MAKRLKYLMFLIVCFMLIGKSAQSQDLKVNVTMDASTLSPDVRDRLKNFVQQVQDYLNKNKFQPSTKVLEPDYTVEADFNFFFRTGSSDNYDVQLFVSSRRKIDDASLRTNTPKYSPMFRFLDERVSFFYNNSLRFERNDSRFEPLVSLLDYYAYMILGYDEDSYFVKGGTSLFQKALDICNKPMTDKKGWTESGGGSKPTRLQIVQELLSVRFDNYRKGIFEYMWMGIDSMSVNKRDAYKNVLSSLERIDQVRKNEIKSYNIDIFYDAKNKEIADLFTDYGDRTVYDKLIKFDPSHRSVYEDAQRKAR